LNAGIFGFVEWVVWFFFNTVWCVHEPSCKASLCPLVHLLVQPFAGSKAWQSSCTHSQCEAHKSSRENLQADVLDYFQMPAC